MFAEAAGWSRPIRIRGGVGGHLDTLAIARSATSRGVRRLVFVHIGRPRIRASERGGSPPLGEFARDGQVFIIHRTGSVLIRPDHATNPLSAAGSRLTRSVR